MTDGHERASAARSGTDLKRRQASLTDQGSTRRRFVWRRRLTAMLVAIPCFLAAAYMWVRAEDAFKVADAREIAGAEQPRDALTAAERAPAEAPNRSVLLLRARARAELGRHRAAARDYQRAVQREPSDWLARRDLAVVLARAGERGAARAQMAKALALNPRMAIPFGFARQEDLVKLRRQQRRAARAAGGVPVPPR